MPLESPPAGDLVPPDGGATRVSRADGADEALPGARASALLCAAGLAATVVYLQQVRLLPHGAEEFAYHPARLDLFPFSPMRGFTPAQLVLHALRLALLAPALWLFARGLARFVPAFDLPPERARRLGRVALWTGVALVAALLFGLFRGRAIYDDELTYFSQARLLAEGRLLDAGEPLWPPEPFTVRTLGGATGKYLFGEPLVQVPGLLVGLAPLAHLPLVALTLLVWHRLVARRFGDVAALGSTLLLACSPMLLFTAPTGLSQTSALATIVVAAYGADLATSSRSGARPIAGALLCGGALGFGLAVRAQSVAPFGGVLGVAALVALVRARRWAAVGALVGAGGAGLAAIALYDWRLSGDPFTLPWAMSYPLERYGFGDVHTPSIGYRHTVGRALENLATTLVRWNGWSLGWPASLALVALWWRAGRPWRGAGTWLVAGAALVAFNFCYLSPGASDLGPIYYFELLLPFTLVGGLTLASAFSRRPRATLAFVLVHLLVGTGSFLVEQKARLGRLVAAVHGSADRALAEVRPPALLLHEQLNRESPVQGWLLAGFPWRFRGDDDPVITFPRQDARHAARRRAANPGRACYYRRFDPDARTWRLDRCAAVEELLARPPLPSLVRELLTPAEAGARARGPA